MSIRSPIHRLLPPAAAVLGACLGLLLPVAGTAASAADAAAGAVAWQGTLPEKAAWHRVLDGTGALLVAGKATLSVVDPDSGKVLWTRSDLGRRAPSNVQELPGTPLLLVDVSEGGLLKESSLQAISQVDGKTSWQTPKVLGLGLGTYPVPARGLVVVFSQSFGREIPAGIWATAYRTHDGSVAWQTRYRDTVTTHANPSLGQFIPTMDFSGQQPPLVDNELLLAPFDGLTAFNLETGAIAWDAKFKSAHAAKYLAYAAPVVSGDTVFAGGQGLVYAIDRATGTVKWTSAKVRSALIAQLIATDTAVFARLGGNFREGKEFKLDEPLGVVAFERATGQIRWEFKGAEGGITNLLYHAPTQTVLLADATSLVALDAQATGKVKEAFRLKLEFKRKLGAADVTSSAIKGLGGLLSGGIAGGLQGGLGGALGNSAARQDPPVALTWQGADRVVVRGQQHLLSFEVPGRTTAWSVSYPAPGYSGFAVVAMSALTVYLQTASAYGSAVAGDSYSRRMDNVEGTWGGLNAVVERRFTATKSADDYTYVLTQVEAGGEKGVGIMAVGMQDGQPAAQVLIRDKEPDYEVDRIEGRLYVFDGREVKAWRLR